MGVALYFSNQLMPLADKLWENLTPTGDPGTILDPPVVVVPNMNLSKWIKLTLARKSDIFMNVAFEYLETGLWRMLRTLDPDPSADRQLAESGQLTLLLFFILMSSDRDERALAPVNRYLYQVEDGAAGDLEIRCWQLAEQLARLFQAYEYHRADMIDRWLATDRGGAAGEPHFSDAMERCQQWIYLRLHHLKRRLARPLRSLGDYAREITGAAGFGGGSAGRGPRPRVHFFGLSQLAPFHLQVMDRLQSRFDIHIYSLNPSREYWEDIRTPLERRWMARTRVDRLRLREDEILAGELFGDADHPLLSAWGKPGRESIRMLCQLSGYDFQAGFEEIQRDRSVLGAVAHGLLTLDAPGEPAGPLEQDTSLQIVACPGIRREVETVYNSIVYNLEKDPDLCMTDIAVMVTDMNRYKPVVDVVFNRRPARITYNLVDANAREESVFARAVMAIMELARGRFSRKPVFDLLRNPCVMLRWGYGPPALAVWIGWTDALGIFHDYEGDAGGGESLPAAGQYTWRQGLERLRLARIMTAPDAVPGSPEPHFQGLVPYRDIDAGDDRLIEQFCLIVETLQRAVATLKNASASARIWRERLLAVLDQFIRISADMQGESAVFQSLVRSLDHLLLFDDLMQVQPGHPLTAEALWVFVRAHLEGLSGGQGDYLTGGVTVSALMPMRPIPFKIVYILGLEEGRFPGQSPESRLDLRCRQRRIGDITPVERNRYLFLETLISVGRKLYLSYVARDLCKDRDQAPCSVIHQLRHYLEQAVLSGRAFKVARIPMRADSAAYLAPDAVNHWSDVLVNRSVAQQLIGYRRHGQWEAFIQRATPDEQAAAARCQPDFGLPQDPPADRCPPNGALTIADLRHFLLDPVAVAVRHHLGAAEMDDVKAELAEKTDEPLRSQFPVDYHLRTHPLHLWLTGQMTAPRLDREADRLSAGIDAVYADLARKSRVPTGAFALDDRTRVKQEVMIMGGYLIPVIEKMRAAAQCFGGVSVGAATAGSGAMVADLTVDPVTIDLPIGSDQSLPDAIELSGALPWVWQTAEGQWHCLVITGATHKHRGPDKYVLAPLLAFMVLCAGSAASPLVIGNQVVIHIAYRQGVQRFEYRLHPELARRYLTDLAVDFYTLSPLVWLPFASVVGQTGLRRGIVAERIGAADRTVFYASMTALYAENADTIAGLAGAAVPPDIIDIARRRFRIFLS